MSKGKVYHRIYEKNYLFVFILLIKKICHGDNSGICVIHLSQIELSPLATHEPNLGTLNQTAKNVILALNYNKSSIER